MTFTELIHASCNGLLTRIADEMSIPLSTLSSALKPYDRRLNIDQDRIFDLIEAADSASIEKHGKPCMDAVRRYGIRRLSRWEYSADGDLLPETRTIAIALGSLFKIQGENGSNPHRYPKHIMAEYLGLLATIKREVEASAHEFDRS